MQHDGGQIKHDWFPLLGESGDRDLYVRFKGGKRFEHGRKHYFLAAPARSATNDGARHGGNIRSSARCMVDLKDF